MQPQWRPNSVSRADEIDGAGDPAAVALGHHQQDTVAHLLADQRIERAREIGPAPFARSGLHVELEERVPDAFGEVGAGQPVDVMPVASASRAFAPDGLALARGQRGEEIVEVVIAGILPMELPVGALQIAALAEQAAIRASVRNVTWTEEALERRQMSASPSASALRTASACGPGRTSRRRPVAGVNGTDTCSFG